MRSLPFKIYLTHCLMLSWQPRIYSISLDSMQKQQLWFLSDLDECATNTHSCDANAYCNNTIGSHNCTCYSGYNGTGLLCDSEYMTVLLPAKLLFGMRIYLNPCQHLKRKAQSWEPLPSKIKHLGAVLWTFSGPVGFTFTIDASHTEFS